MTQTVLETVVRQSGPSKWDWEVLFDGRYPMMHGFKDPKEEAASEAENGMVLLLAAGWEPQTPSSLPRWRALRWRDRPAHDSTQNPDSPAGLLESWLFVAPMSAGWRRRRLCLKPW
jgi:hypothetical protein